MAEFVDVALFHPGGLAPAAQHLMQPVEIAAQILRMRELLEARRQQFVSLGLR